MRIMIIGFGAIGQRHFKNLIKRTDCEIAICRRSQQDANKTQTQWGIPAFESLQASENWHPDCVIICTPTSTHVGTAQWAINQGSHVLIEKPISHTLDGVDTLIAKAKEQKLSIKIACNLRFHPALLTIKETIAEGRIGSLLSIRAEVGTYLPDWHPSQDYRTEYSARSDLGGGALLTLIHELDYIYWIAGEVDKVIGWRTHISQLEIDVDDITECICHHTSGAISSVHMDFLDRSYNRRSRWVGALGTLDWAWGGPVRLLGPQNQEEELWNDPHFDLNQTYIDEVEDFLCTVTCNNSSLTSGIEGKRVLEIAQQIRTI
ncbi:MAG: Gfo/Idh/MocA family oxidoreductase [Candidatus Latescibacteria bacterium]|jgi:predicted dehydrogenase|nr:Gfo/Idh/MocA family oxidoreductase [Candidatus Latescibacterota bacterium]MBT4141067.1 Gfo/Idh/MocA family oxidoreductase [Candidatus Latescibacterota bacterium]MBT5832388.1 Gfo/Idh/MocA family oxidoreductase [Candidatus Latescibacterota bacterium]